MTSFTFPAAFLQEISQTIPQSVDYIRILPELVLSAFGIVVMLLDPLVDEEKSQKTLGLIAFVGTVAGLLATWYMAQSPGLAFSEHGAGRHLQRVLSYSRHRDRRRS